MEIELESLVAEAYDAPAPLPPEHLMDVPVLAMLLRKYTVRRPADIEAALKRFGDYLEDLDEAREPNLTQKNKPFDSRQMALSVHRLLTYDRVDTEEEGGRQRRRYAATALKSAPMGNHSRQPSRNPRDFGRAFRDEFAIWFEAQPDLHRSSLTDVIPGSRIAFNPAPESLDALEGFVDGDPVVARLVAAGLHRQPDLSFARVVQALRELTAEWDRPGVPGTPQTQAAMGWLSSSLDDDERFLLLVFASLPETVTLPLDLLAEEEGSGFSVEALAQLVMMGVVEEVAPERYRMPAELHRRHSPVVQKTHWSEGLDDLLEPLVDYYEPRLQRVCAAIELHRLKDSVTDRIRAGYSASSRPPMSVEDAHAWWEAEQDNQIRLLDWMQQAPKNDDDDDAIRRGGLTLRLALWGRRIVHAIGADSPADFLTWLEHDRADMHFTTHSARQTVREFDQLRLDSLRRMKDAIERGDDVPDEARIEEIESEIVSLAAILAGNS